ncbi:hypothetical protein AKJ09_09100 [Labilithrix luteola]|uniref:IgGFc-binding protein N-terminal domain-containing protein n=1 Tax=Labilithrix luteola TaxID=1391654 RepID=A0A0K1Q9U5_9BACT|nr:IgGFc-binding protein [Labilithrix luteola]AKV02437.1 hypothetical protein AKJ09_09100 [Labilithrix luteola]
MTLAKLASGSVRAVPVMLLALALVTASACSKEKEGFVEGTDQLVSDGGLDAADECMFQCSLDGRAVISTCTGEVVDTCKDDQVCGGALCQAPCAAAAADRSSNGCEFYFQKPRFTKSVPNSCYAAFVVNSSNEAVKLELELEGKAMDISRALFRADPSTMALSQLEGPLAPGDSAILFLSDRDPTRVYSLADSITYVGCPSGVVPATYTDFKMNGTGMGSSFHLKSNVPVGLATIYPFGGAKSFTPTATLVLPVATWGTEHILVNSWDTAWTGAPAAQIVAAEDGTDVTIVPRVDIQNGVGVTGGLAGEPTTYRLDKGQFLQLVQNQQLTGSFVSSNKPITTIGGHACADIPTNVEACDILAQQIPAADQWGSEYVAVAYRSRVGNEHEPVPYRIVAARDGTQLDYDPVVPPGAPLSLSAGESATFWSGTGDAFVVRSQDVDHPIYVAAYMTGGEQYGGRGDPDFVNLVPTGQYLNSYAFYADPTFNDSSLVIVRAKTRGEFKDVWLECANGNVPDFHPIGARGEYEYARVDLAVSGGTGAKFGDHLCQNGLQRLHSDGAFTATIWGWDAYASYAYTGGLAQRKLVKTPLGIVH